MQISKTIQNICHCSIPFSYYVCIIWFKKCFICIFCEGYNSLTSFQMQISNIMTESFHHNSWHFIWLFRHWGLTILFPHSELLSRIMSELMCSAVLILQCILHSGLWLIVFRAGRVSVDPNLRAGSPKESASVCFCSILPLSDEDTLWIRMCDI